MGGTVCIPLRRSNREAAGLKGGETLDVQIALDAETRTVTPPPDFVTALKAAPPEMHLYGDGGHAFGLRRSNDPITEWPQLVERWLRTIGMISE